MATIDLATKLGAGIPPSVHSSRFPIHYAEATIDLATAATTKGSALAAADVIEAIDIPAQSVILSAGVEVLTAQSGSTVLTVDVGTGVDGDNFVDGFDLVGTAAGTFAQAPAAFQPIVCGAADTVDVTIATLTTTNTGGVLRVWAIYADVADQRKPGLAAIRS